MASWRLAKALIQFRKEIDNIWPNRDKRSDGSLGDPAHQARKSNHNPDVNGVVRALDVDEDGTDAMFVVEQIRTLGILGDKRLNPGGEIIYEKRIATALHSWSWRPYTGSNGHTIHFHLSIGSRLGATGYDSLASWGIKAKGQTVPVPVQTSSVFRKGDLKSDAVKFIQAMIDIVLPGKGPKDDGVFGAETERKVIEFQKFARSMQQFAGEKNASKLIKVDGIVGEQTLNAIAFWVGTALGK